VQVLYVDHLNQRTTYTDPRLAFAAEKKTHQAPFRWVGPNIKDREMGG
jgi:hypothetical protein